MGLIRSIAIALMLAVAPLTLAAESKPLRVLFIGNSYTGYNGEPAPRDILAIKNQKTGEPETIPPELAAHLREIADETVRHHPAAATQALKK